jgi:pyrroloquinoline quinone biosynthesis protein E
MTDLKPDFYPILKDQVRIKKLPFFCWIIDRNADINDALPPHEAFILALCNGELTFSHITYIIEKLHEIPAEEATAIVRDVLWRREVCLTWSDCQAFVVRRYDPRDYLYRPDPNRAREVERCETPCEMFLSLTHACNFRCIYCFNAAEQRMVDELSTEEWLSIIEQASALNVLRCTLTGGEPLLHPGIFTILEVLDAADILTCLCTNGSLIDTRVISKLRALKNPPLIQVSLDSADAEIHGKLTTVRASFDAVLRALKDLSDAGLSVQVKSVLTPLNSVGIVELIDRCVESGVERLILDRFSVSSTGRGAAELLISDAQMDVVKRQITAHYERYAGKIDVRAVAHRDTWTCEADAVPCGAFRRSFIVLPNGDVSACEKLIGVPEMTVGNIRRSSVSTLWNDENINAILFPPRERFDRVCQECSSLPVCRSGCYAIKYFLGVNPYGVDPRCYKAEYLNNPYHSLVLEQETKNVL